MVQRSNVRPRILFAEKKASTCFNPVATQGIQAQQKHHSYIQDTPSSTSRNRYGVASWVQRLPVQQRQHFAHQFL